MKEHITLGIFMIVDLFSKRQKKLRKVEPDIYEYDVLSKEIRVQIIYLFEQFCESFNPFRPNDISNFYDSIVDTLRKEYGRFQLIPIVVYPYEWIKKKELEKFFLSEQDVEKALDVVEMGFKIIAVYANEGYTSATEAIDELNTRFKEHAVGYQFVNGEIIRIDSEFLHSEIVKPVLQLLRDERFRGAEEEFLKAHEHFRHSRYKEAINECLKSFESVMKVICDKNKWDYKQSTAANLIETCLNNNLIPRFGKSQFDALGTLLQSSIPTARNKLGAHGQGGESTPTPGYLVAYILHMTASTLLFLITAEQNLGGSTLQKIKA